MSMKLKLALLCSVLLGCAGLRATPPPTDSPLQIQEEQRNGTVQVWAENKSADAPYWAWLGFAANDNAGADAGLPQGFVLRPLDRRLLFSVHPVNPSRGFSYALDERIGEGDPTQEPDAKAVYLLPWAHGSKQTLTQGYLGRVTHQGLYALDFGLPEGTPIHAARDGVVLRVKQDSDRGGLMASDAEEGNLIEVMHDDGTWAIYAHLQYHGAEVQVGERVKAGERIGLSGKTGLASGPHLHFAVYRASWTGPQSIPTVFQTSLSGTAGGLEEGRTYYSYHPDGEPFTPVLGADLKAEDFRGRTSTVGPGPVTLREERVDERNVVWARNGTGEAVEMEVGMEGSGVRASEGLPYQATVPAHTEQFLFFVDFLPGSQASYRLKIRYRPVTPEPAP
jgi:murein DD-endopeptidase MepM/ murein hydrolase activator NlpD